MAVVHNKRRTAAQGSPEHLVEEILLRLPVKSLGQFKTVNKSWRFRIESWSFILQHLSVSKQRLSDTANLLVVQKRIGAREPESFSSISITLDRTTKQHKICSKGPVSPPDVFFDRRRRFKLVNSSFGVYCLADIFSDTVVIWNPATRDSRILPPSSSPDGLKSKPTLTYTWFGFGSSNIESKQAKTTLEFKFVRMRPFDQSHFEIFSFNTGTWRLVRSNLGWDDSDKLWFVAGSATGVNLHGAAHWIVKFKEVYTILSFNFGSEQFASLELPQTVSQPEFSTGQCFKFTLYDNQYLSLIQRTEAEVCHIWLMLEYGSKKSWTKHSSIQFDESLGINKSIAGVFFGCRRYQPRGCYLHNWCPPSTTKVDEIGDEVVGLSSYVESLVSIDQLFKL